jgi:hypothetical protein
VRCKTPLGAAWVSMRFGCRYDAEDDIRLTGEDGPLPDPRIIWRMSDTIFTPGADVFTPRGRGAVVDVRATPSGKFVVGVEDVNGEVSYFTEKALRLARS